MQIIRIPSDIRPEPCVAAIGFFDGVHKGHRSLICQTTDVAAARGLYSGIVTFPQHPRKVIDPSFRPQLLTTPEEKNALLAGTGIDYCLMPEFTSATARLTAREFMEQVLRRQFNVQVLVIGYDHRFGHNRSEGFADYVRHGKDIGIDVVQAEVCRSLMPSADGVGSVPISSSVIRQLIRDGRVDQAECGLGYTYFLSGTVVSGYQVGRKIGFPTANLRVENPEKAIPADGVYAVWVEWDGKRYKGMLNIGYRPTIGNGPERSIEVHILHFNGDIYDRSLQISFVKRIRPELKFDGIDALIAHLHRDAEETEKILA